MDKLESSQSKDIVFLLNKPSKFMRKEGGLSMTSAISDYWGECRVSCEPKACEGEPPECFDTLEDCECWDEGQPGSLGAMGRCTGGSFCWLDEHDQKCEPANAAGQMCLKEYRDNWQGQPQVGPFNEDETCSGDIQGEDGLASLFFEEDGVEALVEDCGCKTGRCRFQRILGPTEVRYYCVPNVTKKFCLALVKAYNASTPGQLFGGDGFDCCKPPKDCECENGCPPGMPQIPCTASEYFVNRWDDGAFVNSQSCFCRCKTNYRIGPVIINGQNVGKLCVVCGENSTWNKVTSRCECNDGFQTPSGGTGYSLDESQLGPEEDPDALEESVTGEDGYRTATCAPCVQKNGQ